MNLQIYCLYESSADTDMLFLVLDFDENIARGIMFWKDTLKMACTFTLKQPVPFTKVDNIYSNTKKFELHLVRK